jgi:hypothetical protein
MKNILKGAGVLLLAALLVFSTVAVTANTVNIDKQTNNNIETEDVTQTRGISGGRGSFPILATIPLPNAYSVGVGWDGTYFWVSAGDQQTGFCEFYLYDDLGNLIDQNPQGAGATGWGHRDMAWDGSYMFGSFDYNVNGFSDIYTYDGSFVGIISPNRAMAYDGTYFYTCGFGEYLWRLEWDGIWGSTATATQLTTTTIGGCYGLAYDSARNCLWMTTADYSGNIFQYDMTGNLLNTYTSLPEYDLHGGCTMADTPNYGEVLCVLMQSDPDTLVLYNLGASIDVEKEVLIPSDFPCDYTLCLEDTYGDGWNDGWLNVSVNGVPLYTYLTIVDGYGPECYTITVNGGDVIFVDYTPGGWPEENVWYLTDCGENELWRQQGSSDPNAHDMTTIVEPGSWIDADTPEDAVDVEICTIVEFRITIHNNGLDPVWDVSIYDWFDDSLEFADANPYPTYIEPGYIEWIGMFPDELYPCETIEIHIWFHVVGPHCSIDENLAIADANSQEGLVMDEDSCFVHCVDPLHIDVEKYVWVPGEPCDYQIGLYDTYGDGWDNTYPPNNYVLLFINGDEVGNYTQLDTDPNPIYFNFTVSDGDEITTDYVARGSYPSENEYFILDCEGTEIRREGAGGVIPGDILPGELIVAIGELFDADTEGEAVDLQICTYFEYIITIHNDGVHPLYDIWVYDEMDDSIEFLYAEPEPDDWYYDPDTGKYYINWYFPGPLFPCETITITIYAHVVGPACEPDENYVYVEGHNDDIPPFMVTDEDSAWVHPIAPPEYIFDNEDPNWIYILGWMLRPHPNAWNADYRMCMATSTPVKKAICQVDGVVPDGNYDVYVNTFGHPAGASNQIWIVKDRDSVGPATLVNMSGSGWVYLGNYDFDTTSMQGVATLAFNANGIVIVDAVKLVGT